MTIVWKKSIKKTWCT